MQKKISISKLAMQIHHIMMYLLIYKVGLEGKVSLFELDLINKPLPVFLNLASVLKTSFPLDQDPRSKAEYWIVATGSTFDL